MFKKLSAKQKILFLTVLFIAVASCLLGGSILNLVHNKLELHRLSKQRVELDAQYEKLLAEKKLLEKQSPKYMETLARSRYNMVKPGEIEFRFKADD